MAWIGELLTGTAVGIVIPLVILMLQQIKLFSASDFYRPMLGLAIGLIVYTVTSLLHGNHFLAGFSAGIATVDLDHRESLRGYTEPIAELLVLGSGVPRAPRFFRVISLVIVGSMIAHSTTDTPIVRWFKNKNGRQQNGKENSTRQEQPPEAQAEELIKTEPKE